MSTNRDIVPRYSDSKNKKVQRQVMIGYATITVKTRMQTELKNV